MNPSTLPKVLEYFKNEYGNPPIYVHENGTNIDMNNATNIFFTMMNTSFCMIYMTGKPILHNGSLNDTIRVDYLIDYIGSVLDAIRYEYLYVALTYAPLC